jgi:hypothetical protein
MEAAEMQLPFYFVKLGFIHWLFTVFLFASKINLVKLLSASILMAKRSILKGTVAKV